MNIFDFLAVKDEAFVYTGNFYFRKPKTPQDRAIGFTYDIVEDLTKARENVLNSLETANERLAIKTIASINFAVGSYVTTQDGKLWEITEINDKPIEEYKQASRFFKNSRQETTLRLLRIDNPWGLK